MHDRNLCDLRIDLESQIANVEYFRFYSFQMQESSFSTVYQAHSQEGFGYFFLLTKLYTLGKAELLAHIKKILRIWWLHDNAEHMLSSASWHFITLSVNSVRVSFCVKLLRCPRQTLNKILDKVLSGPSQLFSRTRVCLS